MAQHDYVIANGTGAAVRSDLNNALLAIVSQNSGATEPTTMYAYQLWADTSTGLLKIRNSANNAWITLRELDGTLTIEDGTVSSPGLAFRDDLNTGIFRPGTDQFAISTNGVERVEWGASEVVFNDGGVNYDFRIEGDNNANLLFVDASADAVGIGTSSPGARLAIQQDSNTITGGLLLVPSSGADNGGWYHNGTALVGREGGFDTIYLNGGSVGIGTTSPAEKFDVRRSGFGNVAFFADDSASGLFIKTASGVAGLDSRNNTTALNFLIDGSEKARLDTSGRLLVGTSTSTNNIRLEQKLAIVHAGAGTYSGAQFTGYSGTSTEAAPLLEFCRSRGTTDGSMTKIESGDRIGLIQFRGADGSSFQDMAFIECRADGATGAGDVPGRLVFSTTADGASSPTERMRITQAGVVSVGHNATYTSDITAFSAVQGGQSSVAGVFANSSSSFDQAGYGILGINCARAANSGFTFAGWYSGNTGDKEFNFRGDGNGYADGTWNGGGADYAEFFEWSDSNPDEEDRRGISVVLDSDKIREAVAGEDPIGVISGNPSVVGDAAWNKWSGKYLRDEFGTYIQEDYEVVNDEGETVVQQRRKLNPSYDPDQEYIPREQRPEWDCVGLMGKLRIRKGQVTGSRWIKMRDISDSVEEWLVR